MQWMIPILIISKAGITMKLNKAQLIQKANENHFKITRERTIYFKESFNSITGNHLDNDARDFTNGFYWNDCDSSHKQVSSPRYNIKCTNPNNLRKLNDVKLDYAGHIKTSRDKIEFVNLTEDEFWGLLDGLFN